MFSFFFGGGGGGGEGRGERGLLAAKESNVQSSRVFKDSVYFQDLKFIQGISRYTCEPKFQIFPAHSHSIIVTKTSF